MEVGDALRQARRQLEEVRGVRVVGDFGWDRRERVWSLELELRIESRDEALIPATTRWFFLLSPRYPWGDIKIHPAKAGGITTTFQHQSHNGAGHPDRPWRSGDACVREAGYLDGAGHDPKGQIWRLSWHVERTRSWLLAASAGELTRAGTPFELPQFPPHDASTVVFVEDDESFDTWNSTPIRAGVVEVAALDANSVYAARRFLTPEGRLVRETVWGCNIGNAAAVHRGAWILLDKLPIIAPYGVPMSCEALFEVLGPSRVALLRECLCRLRDGHRHCLLIGFPIPRFVGQAASRVHWQGVMLPELSGPGNHRGFRNSAASFWKRDAAWVFGPTRPVTWLRSSNWAEAEISTRGRLDEALTSQNILLLGAGALGSHVAQLLVRGGVRRLTIVDSDRLEIGNLGRHTLDLNHVGAPKSMALANQLNNVSPHARVAAVATCFPSCVLEGVLAPEAFGVVIDCSASDDVIAGLHEVRFSDATVFMSASLSRGAKRLYCFSATGLLFPRDAYFSAIGPYIDEDRERMPDSDLPWDGIGCWHPVFPARGDAVASLACRAIQELEILAKSRQSVGLQVIDGVVGGEHNA